MEKPRRILVVDGSRVVRVILSKHLSENFEILEESDGESAWQTLMLDANLAAVITGIHTPKLEGHDLLARLKASSIQRLREIPFVLIVSDVENKAEREFDRTLGVDGFINKSMTKTEIVEYLNNLLDCVAFAQSVILPEAPVEDVPEPAPQTLSPVFEAPKLLEVDKLQSVISGIKIADPKVGKVCALIFGIDNRDDLIKSFGSDATEVISTRIATLLLDKVGPSDAIGRCSGERLGIVAHGSDLTQGVKFANRVCKSLASGQLTIHGQKVKLTASVGVSSSSDDYVGTGNELFSLAEKRFEQALICGGNAVVSAHRPECPMLCQDKITSRLIDALSAQGASKLAGNIGSLGLKILPLLQAMNQELALGLPLEGIQRQLQERAKSEGTKV